MYYKTKAARAIVNWAAWSSCLQQPRPGHEHAAMFPDWLRRPTKQASCASWTGQALVTWPPITYHLTCRNPVFTWGSTSGTNYCDGDKLWAESQITTLFSAAARESLNLTLTQAWFCETIIGGTKRKEKRRWLCLISCLFTTRSWNKTEEFLSQLLYQHFHDWNLCKEVRRYLKSLIATDFRD